MNLSSIKKNEIIKRQFKMTNISGEKLRKIKQVTHHNVVKNCKQPDNGVSEQVIINNHTCILNRAGLKPIGPIARICAIYPRLFKCTQQHTAGFTENNSAPHLIMLAIFR